MSDNYAGQVSQTMVDTVKETVETAGNGALATMADFTNSIVGPTVQVAANFLEEATLQASTEADYTTVLKKGNANDRLHAQEMKSIADEQAAIFVDPGAITETMAATATAISETAAAGELVGGVKDGLDGFIKGGPGGNIGESLDSLLAIMNSFQEGHANITSTCDNIASYYDVTKTLHSMAVNTQRDSYHGRTTASQYPTTIIGVDR